MSRGKSKLLACLQKSFSCICYNAIMLKEKSIKRIVVGVLIFTAGIVFYYLYGWTSYSDKTYDFTISYPYKWKHITSDKNLTNNLKVKSMQRWYLEYGPPSGGGLSFNGEELILSIFDSQDKNWERVIQQTDQLVRINAPGLIKVYKTEIEMSGQKVKEIVAPGSVWVGPINHEGDSYYFSGENSETIKQILQSFKFTN
jgi:hypothetical protein